MQLILWLAIAVLVALAVAAAASWLAWRRASVEERALVKRIAGLPLRRKLSLALGLAHDGRIPLAVRGLPVLTVLYLAMPVDIVPDFIPVLGQLDDLFFVMVAVALLFRFTPRSVLEVHVSAQEKAASGK